MNSPEEKAERGIWIKRGESKVEFYLFNPTKEEFRVRKLDIHDGKEGSDCDYFFKGPRLSRAGAKRAYGSGCDEPRPFLCLVEFKGRRHHDKAVRQIKESWKKVKGLEKALGDKLQCLGFICCVAVPRSGTDHQRAIATYKNELKGLTLKIHGKRFAWDWKESRPKDPPKKKK